MFISDMVVVEEEATVITEKVMEGGEVIMTVVGGVIATLAGREVLMVAKRMKRTEKLYKRLYPLHFTDI